MADKIPIKVNGLPEALSKLRKYQSRKKEQIKDELAIGAFKIETLAKQTVPVGKIRGGRLRASITTDLSDLALLSARVGTDVKYARRIEFGFIGADILGRHYHQEAQPYLYPAFFTYENEIVKAIGRVLRKDIGLK